MMRSASSTFSDVSIRVAIASGAIVPPPGPQIRPHSTIVAWLVVGTFLAGMCLGSFLYGLRWGF